MNKIKLDEKTKTYLETILDNKSRFEKLRNLIIEKVTGEKVEVVKRVKISAEEWLSSKKAENNAFLRNLAKLREREGNLYKTVKIQKSIDELKSNEAKKIYKEFDEHFEIMQKIYDVYK